MLGDIKNCQCKDIIKNRIATIWLTFKDEDISYFRNISIRNNEGIFSLKAIGDNGKMELSSDFVDSYCLHKNLLITKEQALDLIYFNNNKTSYETVLVYLGEIGFNITEKVTGTQ